MIDQLPTLQKLINQLQRVPFFASKNVYRVLQYFLDLDIERLEHFCTILRAAHDNILKCTTCWAWQEKGAQCFFCSSSYRNQSIICVVETWNDLYAIEKAGGYNGVYHVLQGVISPLEGKGPEDLTIQPLLARIAPFHQEVILALNQTPEGEATSAYIARKLESKNVVITSLARGIPVGSSLEYMDRLTVHKAIMERRKF